MTDMADWIEMWKGNDVGYFDPNDTATIELFKKKGFKPLKEKITKDEPEPKTVSTAKTISKSIGRRISKTKN